MKKSIICTRAVCVILIVLLSACVCLAFACRAWGIDPFHLHDRYEVYDTLTYPLPDDPRVLEVRRWEDRDNNRGWDFCLIAADGEVQLLKRTHTLSGAAITNIIWMKNGAQIETHGPSGGFTLTWN